MAERNSGGSTLHTHGFSRVCWIDLILILVFCVAFFGYRIGGQTSFTEHESYVALTASEALDNGHWVVPHCNGDARLQKTPGMYWIVATLGVLAGGINETVVRLPSVISASIIALLMYVIASRMFDRVAGILAGLASASAAGMLWQSHLGLADMTMAMFTTAMMVCFYFAVEAVLDGRRGTGWWVLAYLMFAMGNLTKGPMPFLGAASMAVFLFYLAFLQTSPMFVQPSTGRVPTAMLGRWTLASLKEFGRLLWKAQLGWAVIFVGAFFGAWMISVFVSMGDWHLAATRWKEEWIMRALGGFAERSERPMWYYMPQIFLMVAPWSACLPIGLTLPFRNDLRAKRVELMFLFLWFIVGFVLLSLSAGKRAHYLMPVVPPAILLSAAGMSFSLRRWAPVKNVLLMMTLVLIATAVAGVLGQMYVKEHLPTVIKGYYWLLAIILLMEVFATLAFLYWGELPTATVLALGTGLCFVIVWQVYPVVRGADKDPRVLARQIKQTIGDQAEIYFVGEAHPEVVYYYGKNMPQVPSDQEITRVVLSAKGKPHARELAMIELQDATANKILDMMTLPGRRFFVIDEDKITVARGYAKNRNITIHEAFRMADYYGTGRAFVILSNQPNPSSSPASQPTSRKAKPRIVVPVN
jgi:4-amino-4-deoxy-L-arabinose transferase-like glycosyltransferase